MWRRTMKNILMTAAAMLALSTGLSFAAVGPALDQAPTLNVEMDGTVQLAKSGSGSDGNGGGSNSGSGNSGRGGGDDNSSDDNSTDDNSTDDNSSSSSNSNNDVSGSGRSKPRIKGGSGCDDAGDVAEHAACQ
jgi:hypothetical protein